MLCVGGFCAFFDLSALEIKWENIFVGQYNFILFFKLLFKIFNEWRKLGNF